MRLVLLMTLVLALAALPLAAADANNGKAIYAKSCKACHGTAGEGNPAIAKAMKVELKHLGSPEVQKRSDAEFKKMITEGTGKMKAVKSLKAAEVDDVVAYLHTIKK
jgi:mono/diheme cytochrome c family protein